MTTEKNDSHHDAKSSVEDSLIKWSVGLGLGTFFISMNMEMLGDFFRRLGEFATKGFWGVILIVAVLVGSYFVHTKKVKFGGGDGHGEDG